ncbi:site-2 protease family protein, partial [Clostridium saudiense]|nr:site-2 protease family protein [Clostridium saudiense]
SPLRRISVILAGATMNILFALVIFTVFFFNRGFSTQTVSKVVENSPAFESGLQVGDTILKIDGSRVFTPSDVSIGIQLSKGDNVKLLVDRNGEKKELSITPKLVEENGSQIYQIGFYYSAVENPTIGESIKEKYRKYY